MIPLYTCDTLPKMMNSYWWGSRGDDRKELHWSSWDKLCVPKRVGGLGFCDLYCFNLTMPGKQQVSAGVNIGDKMKYYLCSKLQNSQEANGNESEKKERKAKEV
ncbi:hypothetical protein J1N35_044961 [Gossypium stocksii]|uniref:Uncharacterized protein n=1 Tax=Gossypium stocksii TaxID=47602 RepID=A0A9D3UA92_9ROSI|nr:hypothetical protein J1N35_044961 [Gossypium stocksii]